MSTNFFKTLFEQKVTTSIFLEINCGSPGILPNGWLEGTRTTLHAVVTFRCQEGMTFEGPSYRTICQADGRWSHPLPRCYGNLITLLTQPPFLIFLHFSSLCCAPYFARLCSRSGFRFECSAHANHRCQVSVSVPKDAQFHARLQEWNVVAHSQMHSR